MENNFVKYHPHPSFPWKLMAQKQIFIVWTVTLGQDYDAPFSHKRLLCEILSRTNIAVRSHGHSLPYSDSTTSNTASVYSEESWPQSALFRLDYLYHCLCLQWGVMATVCLIQTQLPLTLPLSTVRSHGHSLPYSDSTTSNTASV